MPTPAEFVHAFAIVPPDGNAQAAASISAGPVLRERNRAHAQLVRRLAVDLLCDRRHRFVVLRDMIGVQRSVSGVRLCDLLIESIRRCRSSDAQPATKTSVRNAALVFASRCIRR